MNIHRYINKAACALLITGYAQLTYSQTGLFDWASDRLSTSVLLGDARHSTWQAFKFGRIHGNNSTYGLRAGYRFHDRFVLELNYQDFGSNEDTFQDTFGDTISHRLDMDAWNLGVKINFSPSHSIVSFHSRLGISFWDYRVSEQDSFFPGEVFSDSASESDIYFGFGVDYHITNQLFASLEYTFYDLSLPRFSEVPVVDHQVNTWTTGISYRF